MTEFFKPLEFSHITGAPHDIPNDSIKKLPIFQQNNAITAKSHLRNFEKYLASYCNDASHDHDDVKMTLFALSLEDDAEEWYFDLDDDSYKTLSEFLEGLRRNGEKTKNQDICFLPFIT